MGKIRLREIFIGITLAVALAGCSSPTTEPEPTALEEAAAIDAASITTIDDGIAWARSLDDTVTANELSEGINRIGDLVPDLDLWFETNNDIGRALITLNLDLVEDPENAGTKVDDLNAIIDDIEAAIEKGPNP